MDQITKVKKTTYHFLLKKAVLNFGINIVFNSVIQYYSLINYAKLHIYEGEQSIVRVFVPLAFFLPFFVTLDVVKYIYKMADKGKLPVKFKKNFKLLHYACKIGLYNGLLILIVTLILLLLIFLNDHLYFEKNIVLIIQVTLSGILAIFFTYQPFMLLKKNNIVLEDF